MFSQSGDFVNPMQNKLQFFVGLFGAFLTEKILEQSPAFFFQNAGDDVTSMIESGMVEYFEYGCGTSALWVGNSINNERYPRKDYRPCAHGAGFLCNIQDGICEAPVPDSAGGLGYCDHFGVGGRITEHFNLVMGPAYDRHRRLIILVFSPYNYAAGWDFVLLLCQFGLFYGKAHIVLVIHVHALQCG